MDDLVFAGLLFWQKLQLTHCLGSLPSPDAFRWHLTTFEIFCIEKSPLRHTVSQTYQLLVSPYDLSTPKYLHMGERLKSELFGQTGVEYFEVLL